MTTERDFSVLRSLRRYKFLTVSQIRSLHFPSDKDGSVTRHRLRKFEAAGLASRRRAEVANPLNTLTMPVWTPTEQGCCLLATHCKDMTLLLDAPPNTSAWQLFAHHVAVSDFFIQFDQALAKQSRVIMHDLFFEHDIVNPDADTPSEKYRLNTIVAQHPRRIIAAPDAAFELQVGPYRRAYYLEYERGFDAPQKVAAKKAPGMAGLNETQKFKRHFSESHDMRVLAIVPNVAWLQSFCKALQRKKGAELWLVAAMDEINAESILHGDIIYSVNDGPRPLVRPEASPQR